MSRLTVVVPSALISPVRDGLLALHEVRAEAATGQESDVHAPIASVAEAVAQLEEPTGGPGAPAGPRALAGDRDVLAGAIHAALLASAEHVVRTCHDFSLPDGDVTPIGDALAQTVAAHRLLSSMDHAA